MEEAWLRSRLESGRSIESIAREAGKAPSTVAYWVNKYGLHSRHAPQHAARGGIARERLEELVAEGLSIRAMALELSVSYSTVRHWLLEYELQTPRAVRLAETAAARPLVRPRCSRLAPARPHAVRPSGRDGGFRPCCGVAPKQRSIAAGA